MTRSFKRAQATIAAALLAAGVLLGAPAAAAGSDTADGQTEYVVLAEPGASATDVLAAIAAAGGTVTSRNTAIGSFRVLAPRNGFVEAVATSRAVFGATRERAIGRTPGAAPVKVSDPEVEKIHTGSGNLRHGGSKARMDPLDSLAWGLAMVKADRARKVNDGSRRVLVGILDSGIDASHPDLAGQLATGLSRNFTTDIPEVDGPCEVPSCVDPPTADDSGHGTHVAGTVAAAANGLGVSGVAPGVRLVSIRGGQDSGFLFLGPVTNALTYGADIGVDVINMSFYVDPWLYNCTANPADSPEAQLEQQTIIEAMNRALDYAHRKSVTLVGSLGNNHEDLGHPRTDFSSPDYPPLPDITYPRPIDNATCWDLPVEGHHVIGVSALGPSTAKADYSNYGLEQISVSAPGGWFRDGFGTPTYRTNGNQILSTYPLHVLQAGLIPRVDADGNITPAGEAAGVMKDCKGSTCGYYAYLQGTSMASPHATGVAALAVSRFGVKDPRHKGGLRLAPWKTELVLTKGAAEHACPVPPLYDYTVVGRDPEFNALCEGKKKFNGFYGHGIVDAYATVTRKFKFDDD